MREESAAGAIAAEIQWNRLRVSRRARPHGDRQSHDVHRRETGDRERADQPRLLRAAAGASSLGKCASSRAPSARPSAGSSAECR